MTLRDPVYLIHHAHVLDRVSVEAVEADEIRKRAGVPAGTPWDDPRIIDALEGAWDYASLESAKDRLIDEYGNEMAEYISAYIKEECEDYDQTKDCDTPYPLCAPWFDNSEWITEDDFIDGRFLTDVLDDLADEAVETFNESKEWEE